MKIKILISRIFICLVLFLNLQAALYFFFSPTRYISSFQLQGDTAIFVVQSIGVLFLMWSIPYIFAAIDPLKNITSLIQAMIMQLIGVIGETILFYNIPSSFDLLKESIQRFIIFDSCGLFLLLMSYLLVRKLRNNAVS